MDSQLDFQNKQTNERTYLNDSINICFMQSTLQVLLNLHEFRTDIQSISKRKLDEKNMKLIREFQNIIKEKKCSIF